MAGETDSETAGSGQEAAGQEVAGQDTAAAIETEPSGAGAEVLSAVDASGAADPAVQAIDALGQAAGLAEAGGPVVLILGVLSVFALAIVIAKAVQFAAARVGERRSARAALDDWREGRTGEAFARARASRNPAARVLAIAMEGLARGMPEARIREHCYAEAQRAVEALRGWMRPLEVIGSLAPLLGLFGTVLGMIEAFGQLEAAGSQVDPAILSGGIWEALLTTAVGLAVAIPVVAAANWFERRIERVEHDIDTGLASLFAADWRAEEARDPALFAEPDRATVRPLESDRSSEFGAHGFRPATAGE